MKKYLLTTLALTALLTPISIFAAIVTCDGNSGPCNLTSDLQATFKNGYVAFVIILSVLGVAYFLFWAFALGIKIMQGADGKVLAPIKAKTFSIVLGTLLLASAWAIYFSVLRDIGVKDNYTAPIKKLYDGGVSIYPFGFYSHASAATGTGGLDSPIDLGGDTSDFLINFAILLIKVAVRWIGFPILIGLWVFVGFRLVAAQGAPQKLADARKMIWISFILTVIIMLAEVLLTVVRDTLL